jgi:general nucleoside transport system ATP-binding protein
MLIVHGISKRFGSLQALDQVSVTAEPGQVHGIVGENGAGKSTLMQVLFGLIQPDHGHISWQGKPYAPSSPQAAHAAGMAMVHQHFSLIPTLSVLANIVLAVEKKWWGFSAADWRVRITEMADHYGWTIPLDTLVENIPVAVQQHVEIMKALFIVRQQPAEKTCLVLDEPTAALTHSEANSLLKTIRRIAADGTTVLLISHKLREIQQVCDVVTVLRRGRVVHHGPATVDAAVLSNALIGHAINMPHHRAQPAAHEAPILITCDDVCVHTPTGNLTHINCTLRAGEIVAIAGVAGNGQQQLISLIRGQVTAHAGTYRCYAPTIGYIPEDRARDALVLPLSIRDNLLLKHFRQTMFHYAGWRRLSAWQKNAEQAIRDNDIRTDDAQNPVAYLSGGNQQKVVIARELAKNPACVVAVNPTRGLDLAAAAYVFEQLIAARQRGAGILLIHPDLDDIMTVADRIYVLHAGELFDSGYPACDRMHIAQLMTGVTTTTTTTETSA